MFDSVQTNLLDNLADKLTELVGKKTQNVQISETQPINMDILKIQKNLDDIMLRFHEISSYVKKNSESIFLLSFFQVLMKKIWSRQGHAGSVLYRKDLDAFEETYHSGLRGDVYLQEFFSAVFQKSKSLSSESAGKIKKTVIFRRLQHFFRDLAKRYGPSVSDCRSNSDIRIFGSGIKVLEFVELRECLFRTQDSLVKFAWWICDRPTSDPRLQNSLIKVSKKRKLAEISKKLLKKEELQSTEVVANTQNLSLQFEDIPVVPENTSFFGNESFPDLSFPFEIEGCLYNQQTDVDFSSNNFLEKKQSAGELNQTDIFVLDIFS